MSAADGISTRLWRSARLRRHTDFQKVYRNGRRIFSTHMTFFFVFRDLGPTVPETGEVRGQPGSARVGFTVPRVLGSAVERNRIRRRLREAVRLSLSELGDAVDIVIHPKKSVFKTGFTELREEIARGFQRIKPQVAGRESRRGGVEAR